MDEYTKDDAFADFNYLIDNMNFFYQKYGDKYVLICNQQLLGVFCTEDEANQFMINNDIYDKCIMRKCFDFNLANVFCPYKYF